MCISGGIDWGWGGGDEVVGIVYVVVSRPDQESSLAILNDGLPPSSHLAQEDFYSVIRWVDFKVRRAEKNVKVLNLSVDLMKKESSKLLERAALAEKDMKRGQKELMNSGGQIHRLAKSVYKVEAEAVDLMDGLREIPGREALKLRAEASPAFHFLSFQCSLASSKKKKHPNLNP
ncbi:hypothetical protein Gotri_001793 [Gossypium trilobum]|uniref:Uncharacterized protein n=1 Tax=Gossypium trilobum TaxID=34281 RepID=A0A7J9FG98_9ROSI|nr:hypothetical protein [Gossypium trilobum]